MKTVLHRSETRGRANHGWLDSHHTFSFANYYHPDRMHFGVLRVLNDDVVQAGAGFSKHPHDNMEIVSIPLKGALGHKDSLGNEHVIRQGEIQVMSAGTGVEHSEHNAEKSGDTNFLQIWIFPDKRGVQPRYDQYTFNGMSANHLHQILSPDPEDEGVWIYQNAWIHRGILEDNNSATYTLKRSGNGIYCFVISGEVTIAGQSLRARDGLGIWDVDAIAVSADRSADILIIEVPMTLD